MSSTRIAIAGSRLVDLSKLGDMAIHLDFSDASTLEVTAGGGGGNPSNGDRIGLANDLSGNGYNVRALDATNRFTYQTGILGGRAGALVNGAPEYMLSAANNMLNARSAFTLYAMVKWASAPAGRQTILSWLPSSSSALLFEHGASVANPGRVRIVGRRLTSDAAQLLEGATAVGTTARMLTATVDWTNTDAFIYLDRVIEASNTSFLTSGVTQASDGQVSVGGAGSAIGNFNGHIFELVGFWNAPNAAQHRAVWQYFRNKYSI